MGFFDDWFKNVKTIILQPKEFFKTMPTTGGFGEPLKFALINLVIGMILAQGVIVMTQGSELNQILQIMAFSIFEYFVILIIFSLISTTISLFISSAIYHLFLKLVGAKKNYEITFRVMAYLTAFSLLVWIPIINIFVLIYYFYILVVVLKEIHEITLMRVIIAITLMIVILFIILSIMAIGLASLWTANIQQANQLDSILTTIDVNKPDFQCTDPGCTTILIQLNDPTRDNVMKTIDILEKRIYGYGIRKKQLQPIEMDGKLYVQLQIPIPNVNEEELRNLVECPGKFEATIDRKISVENNRAKFNFNKNPHNLEYFPPENAIKIDDTTLMANDTIILEDITVKYINKTGDIIRLRTFLIASEDIEQVFNDAQHTSISGTGSNWQYQFSIKISQTAANRVAKVTNDLTKEFSGSRSYLSSNIDLYLDGEVVDSLKISSDLQGKAQDNIPISGPANSRDDAWKNMNQLQSILESGALPTEIEIIQINRT